MIRSYFKVAFRNLTRYGTYTLINVSGLAISITACLLIYLAIRFETSFDNFHKDKDRIYQIVDKSKTSGGYQYGSGIPLPLVKALRNDFPQLEMVAGISHVRDIITIQGNNNEPEKKFKEKDIYFAEPQFFSLFNFPLVAGDTYSALNSPNSVLLTQSTAVNYFGAWENALGRLIKFGKNDVLKVTGILKDIPANTDFPLDVVISYSGYGPLKDKNTAQDWTSVSGRDQCFIRLPGNISADRLDDQLKTFAIKYKGAAEAESDMPVLRPLADVHYNAEISNFSGKTFNRALITTLSLIAVFLLLLAGANFVNLSTAQAVNRSKEVGIRKVLGGIRRQLFYQFIFETSIIVCTATCIALLAAFFILPIFNNLLEISTSLNLLKDPRLLVFLVLVVIAMIMISGFYPAVILSGFSPILALKNKITTVQSGGVLLRKSLVILQFVVAQILIFCTLSVIEQIDYTKSASMGFQESAIITTPIPVNDSVSRARLNPLRDRLRQLSGIDDVSFSLAAPADEATMQSEFQFENSQKKANFEPATKWADAEFPRLFNLKLIAGRTYKESDTITGIVVNETFVKRSGFLKPEDILSRKVELFDGSVVTPIIGVVKDFHISSFHDEIIPVIMGSVSSSYKTINIRLNAGNIKNTIDEIRKIWNSTYPEYVFEYQFLDDKIANFYHQEYEVSKLYDSFAAIAILISCLGLYGLISFTVVQRRREVGIRKLLGAPSGNIVFLFSKEIIGLIILAAIISVPIEWILMNKWLENFAYRIRIGIGLFAASLIASTLISLLTIAYKTLRAARANPIKSLRIYS